MKLLMIVPLLVIAGCSQGEQRGGYAVSTVRNHFFDDPKGFVIEFRGNKLNSNFELEGVEIGLLFIVYVGANEYADGYNKSSSQHGTETSTSSITSADRTFAVSWNRKSGLVEVAGEKFNRKDGNVIVLIKSEYDIANVQLDAESNNANITDIIKAISDKDKALHTLAEWVKDRPR